jgi:hypothetical protein
MRWMASQTRSSLGRQSSSAKIAAGSATATSHTLTRRLLLRPSTAGADAAAIGVFYSVRLASATQPGTL